MKGAEPIFINKKSKTGVLLIHGFTSTPYQFKELADYLSGKGFNVSVPLLPGHGTFAKDLIPTTPKDWQKAVEDAYIDLKKISKKVFIVGNSFGCNLALWLVKKFDNQASGIITLGAPIFLRYHFILVARLYTYGFFQKYYKKPQRIYKTDYTDMIDEITYPIMPTKNLREFFSFIKNETKCGLDKIKIPAFISHSNIDPVVNPKSATYIYENLGSDFKKIFWVETPCHTITDHSATRPILFQKIFEFIQEVIKK